MRPYEGSQADAALHSLHNIQCAPFCDHTGQIGECNHMAGVRSWGGEASSGFFHPGSRRLGGSDALRQTLQLVRILSSASSHEMVPKKIDKALSYSEMGSAEPPCATGEERLSNEVTGNAQDVFGGHFN